MRATGRNLSKSSLPITEGHKWDKNTNTNFSNTRVLLSELNKMFLTTNIKVSTKQFKGKWHYRYATNTEPPVFHSKEDKES